ncbi:MAG: LEA type 2 family protein [Burkholderiales bacterium]
MKDEEWGVCSVSGAASAAPGAGARNRRDDPMLKRLFLGLCLAAVIAGCGGKRAPRPEPLRVTLVSIMPVEVGVLEQRYAVRLRVQNPRPYNVPLDGVTVDIAINGRHFARGVGRLSEVVPAFEEQLVDISAVSTTATVVARIGDLQRATGQEFRYRLDGRFYNAAADGYNGFVHSSVFRFGVAYP